MTVSRRSFLQMTGAAALAAGISPRIPAAWSIPPQQQVIDPVYHLLNRIAYSVRPDELARARQLGVEAYLDEQLNPDSIDDADADARLAWYPILTLDRRAGYAVSDRYSRSYRALIDGMVIRAAHSKRQLFERVVEFWTDHFNIAENGDYNIDLILLHRDVIRRHAFGSFRAMLIGTARSPAMLYYLDNYRNVAEHPNENYARELLELHTLGVDGGYTEDDVKAVARAFTGWTIHDGTDDGFYFDADVHDADEKIVLGHTLPAGRGIEDGLHVLDILARHPATARFIALKLCRRFVSDDPPASLVESAAQQFTDSGGQIAPMLRNILTSAEFQATAGQKLRRPFDFFVGALRATGTELPFWRMVEMLQELAHTPYGWTPPDGYPDTAAAWLSSSGLLARWNAAMTLTSEAASEPYTDLRGHLFERIGDPRTPADLVDAAARQVFGDVLPDEARRAFIEYVTEGDDKAALDTHALATKTPTLFGLMLASPLFQWR
jgi:uncharacterized protein (DUF1800 family)